MRKIEEKKNKQKKRSRINNNKINNHSTIGKTSHRQKVKINRKKE